MTTVEQILQQLNTGEETAWLPVDGYYSFNEVMLPQSLVGFTTSPRDSVAGGFFRRNSVIFSASKGIVVKVFLNTRTGEIKTFFAKNIDSPEATYF